MKHTRPIIRIFCSITLLAATALVQAADSPAIKVSEEDRLRHESTGVLGGAVIGGLVGGPLGAVVTAAFGGWVSDKTLAKKENHLLNAALANQHQELLALQAEYRAMEARFQVAARQAQAAQTRNASFAPQSIPAVPRDLLNSCCKDSELSLHFKTGSVQVESFYDDKLTEFAALVRSLPEAVIEISGHADRRGDSANNLALSQQRVQAVETKLSALGLRNQSLQTNAYGDSRPLTETDSLENNFFDRRVIVRILSVGNGLLTQANE